MAVKKSAERKTIKDSRFQRVGVFGLADVVVFAFSPELSCYRFGRVARCVTGDMAADTMLGILGEVGAVIGECDADNRLCRNADMCPCLLTEGASSEAVHILHHPERSRTLSKIHKLAICTNREHQLQAYKATTSMSSGSCASIVLKEHYLER
jgi:hypothetical protein